MKPQNEHIGENLYYPHGTCQYSNKQLINGMSIQIYIIFILFENTNHEF